MKAEELRAAFESLNEDFASAFEFEDNQAWVDSPKGILTDEALEIMEDGTIEIRMTGDTMKYNSLDKAIDELFDWWSADLIDCIADEYSDLELVETTSDINGYPRDIMKAVVGLSYDELWAIRDQYKGRLEIVSLKRRNGWNLWYREGWVSGDYELDEDEQEENGGVEKTSHYHYDSKEYVIGLIEIK